MHLDLPDNYKISNRILNLSLEERCELLKIGEYLYFNGKNVFENNENEKYTYGYEQKIEEIRHSSKIQIQNHSELVKEQYNIILKGKDDLIDSKVYEIEDLKKRICILEEENTQALSLSNKLDSLMGKGNSVDNAMKGDFGESIVLNQIQHWYQTSEIYDTSADTAKGDMLWKLNNGEFSALVEVKNVQIVRPNEIQKFERDILINTKDNSCNCGIFISIKTENIPNKGKFKLEFINNCPIIYVSNVLNDLNTLRFALDCLFNIQQKLKSYISNKSDEEDNNFQEYIINFIQNQYNKILNLQQNINTMKSTMNNMNKCILNEEELVSSLINSIELIKNEYDFFKQIESEYKVNSRSDLKESILKDMRQFQKENGRVPQLNDLIHKYKISIFREDLAFKKLKNQL